MSLNAVWFVLIAVLWCGYFMLEGFDFGVGMLLRRIGKTEPERRAILTTLGPIWDGNEVWLIVAGGATFAAFPQWYATLFSGFYLPLLIILVGLILRGVAMEFRSKRSGERWRANWDRMIFIGTLIPSVLWGIAFANLARGVPLAPSDATSVIAANAPQYGGVVYAGGFWNLLNPYALLGGATTLLLFLSHGAVFLALKTDGETRRRAKANARGLGVAALVLAAVFLVWTQLAYSTKPWTWALVAVVALAWIAGMTLIRAGREGWSFAASALAIVGAVAFLFCVLYPYVMPDESRSPLALDIFNSASSDYTLTIMTIVAAVFTPVVLIYQAWTYWVFRKRVSASDVVDAEIGSLDLPQEVGKSVNVG